MDTFSAMYGHDIPERIKNFTEAAIGLLVSGLWTEEDALNAAFLHEKSQLFEACEGIHKAILMFKDCRVLVSFFNDPDGGDFFASKAKQLFDKCVTLSVPNKIYYFPEGGQDWISNVRAKPVFLLNEFKKMKEGQFLVWLDADCDILKFPDFEITSDWMVMFRDDLTPHDFVHVIKICEKTEEFLNEWIQETERINAGSHSAFVNLYKKHGSFITGIPDGYFALGLSDTQSKKEYGKI